MEDYQDYDQFCLYMAQDIIDRTSEYHDIERDIDETVAASEYTFKPAKARALVLAATGLMPFGDTSAEDKAAQLIRGRVVEYLNGETESPIGLPAAPSSAGIHAPEHAVERFLDVFEFEDAAIITEHRDTDGEVWADYLDRELDYHERKWRFEYTENGDLLLVPCFGIA